MITLRPAREGDAGFARRLMQQSVRPLLETFREWDQAAEDAAFARGFHLRNVRIIVVDGIDAGWCQTHEADDATVLEHIYLLPAYRQRGVGSHVLERLIAQSQHRNIPMILSVLRNNPARRFYERFGFQIVGQDDQRFYMRREMF
jgi:ribosomal protein S18 acetylase RimI-like enzyme